MITDNTQSLDIGTLEPNENGIIVLESGQALSLNAVNDWVFIPFNHEYKKRNIDLENELTTKGFDIQKLKTDPKYTLDEIVKDVKMTKTKGGKKFREIYESLDGNINQNSMLVYSGPINELIDKKVYLRYSIGCSCCVDSFFHSERVACIYTGDADLNITQINKLFNKVWKNVGTIQIPHHGDLKVFNNFALNGDSYYCPISFGINNTYGHPSNAVIRDILGNFSYPIMVTEKLDSLFIEVIK